MVSLFWTVVTNSKNENQKRQDQPDSCGIPNSPSSTQKLIEYSTFTTVTDVITHNSFKFG
jgi:hypothetical protein